MPILTKEVEVKINNANAKYYESLGYEIPMKKASENTRKRTKKDYVYDIGKTIIVNVNDLQKGSNVKIQYLCDYCHKEILKIRYANFTQRTKEINKMACKNCYTQKIKETSLLRYGVDSYAKTKECQEKMKSTMKSLYGVEHYSQTLEYKDKFHNTCINKYGDTYRQQFVSKAFESFHDKTGYDFPSQSPEMRERTKKSLMTKYGVDSPAKSLEIRTKMVQTLYANSSQKVSRQQRYICDLYQGILNFPIKYYNVDIYLPNDNLIVEYDGSGHLLNVVTGRKTIKEHKQKEFARYNVIKREGYKQMRIVSTNDKLPSDKILLQMLEYAKQYFSKYPEHYWIEFNIDTSSFHNAEYKDGLFFDYGELRRIYKKN